MTDPVKVINFSLGFTLTSMVIAAIFSLIGGTVNIIFVSALSLIFVAVCAFAGHYKTYTQKHILMNMLYLSAFLLVFGFFSIIFGAVIHLAAIILSMSLSIGLITLVLLASRP